MGNNIRTKSGNYLLRSTRRDHLIRVLTLVFLGRIRVSEAGIPSILNSRGEWMGTCAWSIRQLESRGMVKSYAAENGEMVFWVTGEGVTVFSAALEVLGRKMNSSAIMAEIDNTHVER